jgi:protein CpxP
MNRFVLPTTLMLTIFGATAFAQQGPPPQQNAPIQTMSDGTQQPPPDASQPPPTAPRRHMNPHKQAEKLAQQLNLTADQQAKVEPILADHDQKLEAMMSDTSLTPDQQHAQRHALEKDMHAQLASVLTADQMQQMKAMHHDRKGGPMQPATAPPQDQPATPQA